MTIARRKKLYAHGDGRAFSMIKLEKRAYLYAADVLAVIGSLDPTRNYPAAMLNAIAATMATYLGPRLLKQKHLNHGPSLKALEAIARESEKLAQRLDGLDQDYLLLIEENRFEPFDPPEVEKFDMTTLYKKLNRLSHAVERSRASLAAHKKGAPSAEALDTAIEQLLAILEQAQLPVVTTESGSRGVRRKVSGPGGDLLTEMF